MTRPSRKRLQQAQVICSKNVGRCQLQAVSVLDADSNLKYSRTICSRCLSIFGGFVGVNTISVSSCRLRYVSEIEC
jgi:hypothetical protein